MTKSVMRALILKDWALHRTFVMFSIAGGVLALAVLQVKNETAFMIGAIWFFVALILLATMLPMANVINERKKQNLAFLMSLPLSATQYGMSKFASNLGMFLIPWVTLVIAGFTAIFSHREVPHGIIPLMIILFVMPLVGFCFVAGAALIGEAEGWAIAAMIVCNSSYGLAWTLIIRNPVINGALKSPVAIWSSPVRMILGGEIAAILLILGITFFLQSRKREFV